MVKSRDPGQYLPLTPAAFHVLAALADDDKHGYAIMKEVAALTGGSVELLAGTLYGIIKRLLAEGLIEAAPRASATEDERRRHYRLTRFGRRVAQTEAVRLGRALAFARTKSLIGSERG